MAPGLDQLLASFLPSSLIYENDAATLGVVAGGTRELSLLLLIRELRSAPTRSGAALAAPSLLGRDAGPAGPPHELS
ncbi:unnamed protein product [Lampetra planeri]